MVDAGSVSAQTPDSERLVPWVGGRADLFTALPSYVHRFDPRARASAPFFDRVRALDHDAWAEPLGRLRPSWVFYDCALVPGALFGYALAGTSTAAEDLVPVSLLALIPTLDGRELVQSLAARTLSDLTSDALAIHTLRTGVSLLNARELIAAIPWVSPFLSRFLALGPLRLHTAWTPAHDEPATLTFSVTPAPAPTPAPTPTPTPTPTPAPTPTPTPAPMPTDLALQNLQSDLERGTSIFVRGLSPAGHPVFDVVAGGP